MHAILAQARDDLRWPLLTLCGGGILIVLAFISNKTGEINISNSDGLWSDDEPILERKDDAFRFDYVILCMYVIGAIMMVKGSIGMLFS